MFDIYRFDSAGQCIVEVCTEFLYMLSCLFIQHFGVRDYDEERRAVIEICFFSAVGVLFMVNICYITLSMIQACKMNQRKKQLIKIRKAYEAKRALLNEIKAGISSENNPTDSIKGLP